ncbi:MAG: tRNA (adenosine(37)-N6)-threonylcarbamoyltransferase complex ATPase subunit type 1 TsaE [Deltaproteobacteria bacterium]|nr:tRNA (adenosine(37)-N6)-threonylcarbamoyltransferase complex ATPase subunit type 1 TsaE [Deltaproteobacteria bacterium]
MILFLKSNFLKYLTKSANETMAFGQLLGTHLTQGDMVALVGELGSGKTWFAKGLALGLGVSPDVIITSPSFSIVNEYEGRFPFYHMDLYRLGSVSDFQSAGLEYYLDEKGVVAMEWADQWPDILPIHTIWVKLVILDETRRHIILTGENPRSEEIIESMGKEFK